MSLPDIYEYDTTAFGAGSEKDIDKLSRADLKNLESQGYSKQEIIDYSNTKTANGTNQGDKAQALLDKWVKELSTDDDDDDLVYIQPYPYPSKDPEQDQPKQPEKETASEEQQTTTPSDNSNNNNSTTTITESDNNVISGNDIGEGAAVVAGDGSSAVAGNNEVKNIQKQDKDFRFEVGDDAVIYNAGNMNSDLSNNYYNNSQFNAGSATERSDAFNEQVAAALAFQESASQGNPAFAGMSATTGDYSGIPNPLDVIDYTQSALQANIGEMQANANLFGDSVFGRYWPIPT